jgi:hypothetical protein
MWTTCGSTSLGRRRWRPTFRSCRSAVLLHGVLPSVTLQGIDTLDEVSPVLLQASLDAQTQPQQPVAQQLPPGQRSRLGGSAPTADAADGRSLPAAPQQAAAAPHVEETMPDAAAQGNPAVAELTGSADRPADGVASSIMYTSTMNVKGGLAGHPDYLAVLTVVAAFGWVTLASLHRLVVALERDMIEAEVGHTSQ